MKSFLKFLEYTLVRLSNFVIHQHYFYTEILGTYSKSIWENLWVDIAIFYLFYILVSLIQIFYIPFDNQVKNRFEIITDYLTSISKASPIEFMIAIFIDAIMDRWQLIYMSLPNLGAIGNSLAGNFPFCKNENDEVLMYCFKKRILRYIAMSWIFAFINYSDSARDRFRPLDSNGKRVDYKRMFDIINEDELIKRTFGKLFLKEDIDVLLKRFEKQMESHGEENLTPEYWLPLAWANQVIVFCANQRYLSSKKARETLCNELESLRNSLADIEKYKQFGIPVGYSQAIIVIVIVHLITEVLQRRIISNDLSDLSTIFSLWFPVSSLFQLMIYFVWFRLSVALTDPLKNSTVYIPFDKVIDYHVIHMVYLALCNSKVTNYRNFKEYCHSNFMEAKSNMIDVKNSDINTKIWTVTKNETEI